MKLHAETGTIIIQVGLLMCFLVLDILMACTNNQKIHQKLEKCVFLKTHPMRPVGYHIARDIRYLHSKKQDQKCLILLIWHKLVFWGLWCCLRKYNINMQHLNKAVPLSELGYALNHKLSFGLGVDDGSIPGCPWEVFLARGPPPCVHPYIVF